MAKILLSRQIHYMVLVWAFTWFAYWMFFRSQIVAVNIAGAVTCAGIIAFIRLSSARNVATKAFKLATPQINKNVHAPRMTLNLQVVPKVETSKPKPIPSFFAGKSTTEVKSAICSPVQVQKPSVQPTIVKTVIEPIEPVKQASEPVKPVEKPAPKPTQTKGCPKNLEYFTKKPRPKQTPTECFSCKNLISCVCQTSD